MRQVVPDAFTKNTQGTLCPLNRAGEGRGTGLYLRVAVGDTFWSASDSVVSIPRVVNPVIPCTHCEGTQW